MSQHGQNNSPAAGSDPAKTLLCAVLDNGEIALVRVVGRGNFSNAIPFKNFANKMQEPGKTSKFILDLEYCESMDSTFMGVLAGICLTQMKTNTTRVSVVNSNDHCRRLLKNLGIVHLMDLKSGIHAELERAESEDQFAHPTVAVPSRVEQICTMLQAHKELVRLDQKNEVQFQAVIEYLEKSLTEEKGNSASH